MRGSDLIIELIYFITKCCKINSKRGGSYFDVPDWIKKKKATIDKKNDNGRFLQYAAIITLKS